MILMTMEHDDEGESDGHLANFPEPEVDPVVFARANALLDFSLPDMCVCPFCKSLESQHSRPLRSGVGRKAKPPRGKSRTRYQADAPTPAEPPFVHSYWSNEFNRTLYFAKCATCGYRISDNEGIEEVQDDPFKAARNWNEKA